MYRRTTIAAAATALALLGGGSALAANAGLFGGDQSGGAGTLPAVSTLDADETTGPANPPTDVAPSPTYDESHESESHEDGEIEDD